jgi:phage tail sheath protein FI
MMAEYLAPAVYVEEVSFRAKSVAGVGTSTCGFVGMAARGPVGITPPLLTSFADFERYYGGLDDLLVGGARMANYLAHGARAFFANGGGRLYVTRILGTGGVAATGILNAAAAADSQVTLTARTAGGASIAGKPGTNYLVTLRVDTLNTTKALAMKQAPGTMVSVADADPKKPAHAFILAPTPIAATDGDKALDTAKDTDAVTIQTLSVLVTGPEGPVAEYAGLGFHSSHPRPALRILGATPPNAIDAMTNPVMLSVGANVNAFSFATAAAALTGPVALTNGTDGAAPIDTDWDAALNLLLGLEDISIIAAPGSSAFGGTTPASVVQKLIGSAETRRAYRIAVLDTPPGLEPTGNPSAVSVKNGIDSTKAALYYPWIMVANPLAATDPLQSDQIALPPSGFVCGIYARSDINRGVIKAPANETVTGALGLQRDVRFGEQEVLNPLGVNCIRALPNRGIRVWGARTISSDPEWMYVNIRRYFLYLEASIDRGTQWAVFEPNGERLWANVRTTISDFLFNEWVNGALLGSKPEEAFFVNCDRSTMTQNDLDNGRLVCLIGVAALKPAEFVIFRIGQKTADARN